MLLDFCKAALPQDASELLKIDLEIFGNALRANISETAVVLLINEQGEKEKERDEFSWCCSFSWGFAWRRTALRLASRAFAPFRARQSGRRGGHWRTAGPRSSCQSKAADLHR